MTTTPCCPVCAEQLPARDRTRRYCSGACKAKAYQALRQAGGPAHVDLASLPPGTRHARAIEIRLQASNLIAALADTASGQQALFTAPGPARRPGPPPPDGPHRLVADLTALANAATVTKRPAPAAPPRTAALPGGPSPALAPQEP